MSIKYNRYQEYLKSGEWKFKKALKLKQANFTCEGCGGKKGAMEVHHLTYDRIGMELLTDLAAYCVDCHKIAHCKVEPSNWYNYCTEYTNERPKEKLKEDIEWEIKINSI